MELPKAEKQRVKCSRACGRGNRALVMVLRRYAARCLLHKARVSFVVEDAAIVLYSKRKDARSGPIIARRYLATGTNRTAVSTAAGAGGGGGVGRGERGGGGGGGGGWEGGSRGDGGATVSTSSSEPEPAPPVACSSPSYVLPPPSWSLADLKLVQRASDSDENVDEGTAGAVLSREEVYMNRT